MTKKKRRVVKVALDDDLLKEIKKAKLTPKETKIVLKNLREINPKRYGPVKLENPYKYVKFGVVSDLHIGHKDYRPDILRHATKRFKKEGVDFVVNAGDTLEGMSGREGQIYDLTHIGASEQLKYFAKEFKHFEPLTVYSIEAQDSHSGWFRSKGNIGLDIGPELERRSKSYKFIGYDEQDLKLDNGLIIRLRHSGGATAYAISYKMQKYVESISGGKKPHIIIQGHFHKAQYIFYRNVHCFDAGCLQEQSPYMKKKGTPAMLGYWIIEVGIPKHKFSMIEVKSRFYPFYE